MILLFHVNSYFLIENNRNANLIKMPLYHSGNSPANQQKHQQIGDNEDHYSCVLLILIFAVNCIDFKMKKFKKTVSEDEDDNKLQSRMEIKTKLQFVTDPFSISGATEYNHEHSSINNIFPQSNQPTLEYKDTEQSIHDKLDYDSSLQKIYPEGVTARNGSDGKSNAQFWMLEQKNQKLNLLLKQKESEVASMKRKNDQIARQNQKLKNELHAKDELVNRQKRQLGELRQKQSLTFDSESRHAYSSSKSSIEQSINNFCPELLSPQQTLQLLNNLLRKVSKSSKMIKSLCNDHTTKDILAKINKN